MLSLEVKGPLISSTWPEFFAECGERQASLGNPYKAEKIFEEKYRDKSVR